MVGTMYPYEVEEQTPVLYHEPSNYIVLYRVGRCTGHESGPIEFCVKKSWVEVDPVLLTVRDPCTDTLDNDPV